MSSAAQQEERSKRTKQQSEEQVESGDEFRRKVEKPVQLQIEEIQALVDSQSFNLGRIVCANELDSYDDRNYLLRLEKPLKDDLGDQFILKIHNGVDTEKPAFIEAQMGALHRLGNAGIVCPMDLTGAGVVELQASMRRHFVRVLRFIPGDLLYDSMACHDMSRVMDDEPKRLELLEHLGDFLARVDVALKGLESSHPTVIRGLVWDLRQFDQVRMFAQYVTDSRKRTMIDGIFADYEAHRSILNNLRCSVIQNDANDRNLVVQSISSTVAAHLPVSTSRFAILDFGDMIYTWQIAELAIALAYTVVGFFTDYTEEETEKRMDGGDVDGLWLARCAALCCGYNGQCGLEENERKVLYVLAKARLATSACIGAYSIAKDPENVYLLVHSQPAWRSIRAMERVGQQGFDQAMFKH